MSDDKVGGVADKFGNRGRKTVSKAGLYKLPNGWDREREREREYRKMDINPDYVKDFSDGE